MPWVERHWTFDLPVGVFPAVLERLRGTPARAASVVAGVPEEGLAAPPMEAWSAKEHLGHLIDLHALDVLRVKEFLSGAETLTAADVSNSQTKGAGHGATPIAQLLETFKRERHTLILMLEPLTEVEIAATALHPRLGVKMRLVDWVQFVADHDDHHLASARHALRSFSGREE
jgi:hypothetical protein